MVGPQRNTNLSPCWWFRTPLDCELSLLSKVFSVVDGSDNILYYLLKDQSEINTGDDGHPLWHLAKCRWSLPEFDQMWVTIFHNFKILKMHTLHYLKCILCIVNKHLNILNSYNFFHIMAPSCFGQIELSHIWIFTKFWASLLKIIHSPSNDFRSVPILHMNMLSKYSNVVVLNM